jgi:hypothetical protein
MRPAVLEKRRLEEEEKERRRWEAERKRQEAKERNDQDYNRRRRFSELPTEAEVAYGGRTSGCHWLAGGHRVHLRNHTTRRGYGWLHRLRDSGGVHIY